MNTTDRKIEDFLTLPNGQFLHITADKTVCVIDQSNDRYKIDSDTEIDVLLKQQNKIIKVEGHDASPSTRLSEWQTSASLSWQIGLYLSNGNLIKSLHDSSRFKLLRWPPAEVSRTSPNIMTLCALFGRASGTTITEIAAASNIPEHQIIAFINGAYLARAISVRAFETDQTDRPQSKPSGTRSLFEKIRDRLKRKPV